MTVGVADLDPDLMALLGLVIQLALDLQRRANDLEETTGVARETEFESLAFYIGRREVGDSLACLSALQSRILGKSDVLRRSSRKFDVADSIERYIRERCRLDILEGRRSAAVIQGNGVAAIRQPRDRIIGPRAAEDDLVVIVTAIDGVVALGGTEHVVTATAADRIGKDRSGIKVGLR